ncbi:chromate efflux transporter [Glaciecola sp. KUL10]|uniref:chromate efflux transporter n=1 Tax=Glaciecola sp. (strain KUL10) TaxID=2161813 RepID=UPI000D7869AB|nr:chromate efflux transporter [Glaciecola sp. KUL10]GBL06210.1 hypothetical protein KUL10_35480 [Glaciecola sp. KUL10]
MSDIFFSFLKLGCTAFGGPVAHLSYFRRVFVEQKQWLSDEQYAELVAICQVLPGPASSQVGFCLGWLRGGLWGALIAFFAFTMPSVIVLICFANLAQQWLGSEWLLLAVDSLKVLAVFVVFQAVIGMRKNFCNSVLTYSIALIAMIISIVFEHAWVMGATIIMSMLIGAWSIKNEVISQKQTLSINISAHSASISLVLLVGVFVILAIASDFVLFYQAGALVFGGGHVVLPLLEAPLVDTELISREVFISGYGATQVVPGPIFTFASYLGYELPTDAGFTHNALVNALIATLLIFAPGFLLVIAVLPYWQTLSQYIWFKRATLGACSAVVGILAATLINPIMSSTIKEPLQLGLIALGLIIAVRFHLSLLWLLGLSVGVSVANYFF